MCDVTASQNSAFFTPVSQSFMCNVTHPKKSSITEFLIPMNQSFMCEVTPSFYPQNPAFAELFTPERPTCSSKGLIDPIPVFNISRDPFTHYIKFLFTSESSGSKSVTLPLPSVTTDKACFKGCKEFTGSVLAFYKLPDSRLQLFLEVSR